MITTIYEKSREMQNGRLKAFIDNKELEKILNSSMEIANLYNQDRVTKAMAIKRLIDEYTIAIEVERTHMYKDIRCTLQ